MKKIMLTMFFSVFLLCAMAVPTLSQADVGVAVDDWFYYTVDISQVSNATGTWYVPNIIGQLSVGTGYVPNDLVSNNYTTLNRTVTAVDGTNVTFKEEWQLHNGTIVTYNDVVANVTDCNLYWAVIPADLEADDVLSVNDAYAYPLGGAFAINGTEVRTYAGETRETCTMEYSHVENVRASINVTNSWDQTTGILVDSNLTTHFLQSGELTTTYFIFELYASSTWIVVPEFPTASVMLLVLVAVTVSVDIYRRKKLKH